MNRVILIGRLTHDPEVRVTNTDLTIASFTVAVDRGKGEADFPRVQAFGKTAELIDRYVHKGQRIAIEGRIRTGSYTNKNGEKIYTTDVTADRVEFLEKKDDSSNKVTIEKGQTFDWGFDSVDDDLLF